MSSKRRHDKKAILAHLEELESRLNPATFNVSSVSDLLSAIQTADGNTDASNTIIMASGNYILSGATSSEILIQNQSTSAKTLIVTNQAGGSVTIAGDSGDGSWKTRIFEINGNNGLTVEFENLTISGGNVQSTNPTVAALGGGILIDGGSVTLSNVIVSNNQVMGATGTGGAQGTGTHDGSNGAQGGAAEGGGIYLTSGSLTLKNGTSIEENSAFGGKGGNGGAGGVQPTSYAPTPNQIGSKNGAPGGNGANGAARGAAGQNGGDGGNGKPGDQAASLKNGNGGDGGDGGDASGGGIYMAAGTLTIQNAEIDSNSAQGGSGGAGGAPGIHTSISHSGLKVIATRGYAGGNGGKGGNGGNGSAGVSPSGRGGDGGKGGKGGMGSKGGGGVNGGNGGDGGNGGNAAGGGVYIASGALTVTSATVNGNTVTGGEARSGANGNGGGRGGTGGGGNFGGNGGNGAAGGGPAQPGQPGGPAGNGNDAGNGGDGADAGDAGDGGDGGTGGSGGAAEGGGLYIANGTATINQSTFDSNSAVGVNGANGGNGGAGGLGDVGGNGVSGGVGGQGANGGQGGNGGGGGGGGKGGNGGKGGDGGYGGSGLGGGVYLANGTLSITQGTFSDSVTGGTAANGGNGGAGADGRTGGIGANGGKGGAGNVGGHGGNGGDGGSGGSGGNGGNAGHPGDGGNGEGGDIYVAAGALTIGSINFTGGTANGGLAGAAGLVGAAGQGGAGGGGGQAGQGGVGTVAGAPGKAGDTGAPGLAGAPGQTAGPGSNGASSGSTIYGATISGPTSSVNSLPASVTSPFTVSWSGSDGTGPGIASYTISVSVNGGAFKPWLTKTTTTSASFSGVAGDTYAFYSVATDKAGQVQSRPTSAQASTIVVSPARSTVTVSSTIAQSGSSITVTLQARSETGTPITTGGLTVVFKLAAATGGKGTFSAVTDNGNGTYTATFTGTLAGKNTIEATMDGHIVTSTASIAVTPGSASLANSLVVLSASTTRAGTPITITLVAKDAAGNRETTGGLDVAFVLGNVSGANGMFSAVRDNKNGTYTATFTGTLVGTNDIVAMIGGQVVTSSTPAITVTPGPVSVANSVVSLSAGSVQSSSGITVTLQAIDAFGNRETTGGLTVAFILDNAGSARGVFSAVKDNKNGTYTATFMGTIAGSNAITAAIEGHKITSTPQSITVTPGPVGLAKSLVSLSAASVSSGSDITVTLQAKDVYGNKETTGGLTVAFMLASLKGGQGTFSSVTDNGNGTYTATFTGTIAGINAIEATIGSEKVISTAPVVKVTPGPVSLATSVVTASVNSIKIGGITTVTLRATDAAGNNETTGGLKVLFLLVNNSGGEGVFGVVTDHHDGIYTAIFKGTVEGDNTITAEIDEETVTSIPAPITIT